MYVDVGILQYIVTFNLDDSEKSSLLPMHELSGAVRKQSTVAHLVENKFRSAILLALECNFCSFGSQLF